MESRGIKLEPARELEFDRAYRDSSGGFVRVRLGPHPPGAVLGWKTRALLCISLCRFGSCPNRRLFISCVAFPSWMRQGVEVFRPSALFKAVFPLASVSVVCS